MHFNQEMTEWKGRQTKHCTWATLKHIVVALGETVNWLFPQAHSLSVSTIYVIHFLDVFSGLSTDAADPVLFQPLSEILLTVSAMLCLYPILFCYTLKRSFFF